MTSVIFLLSTTIVFLVPNVWGVQHPNTLNPVSNATCQPEYAWMNNAEGDNPCLMVAYVIAACAGDTWTQPALPSGYSYNSPNGTTATPCYCSWSSYNLMMACTICQNPAYISAIKTWPSFSNNCFQSYKDEAFPQGYVIANNVSIPYWATVNPANWTSEVFNVGEAQGYANQSLPDYYPSGSTPAATSTSAGGPNIGAIVGGSIGGAVGFLLVLAGVYLVYKRYQRLRKTNDVAQISKRGTPSMHTRWPSDPSTAFFSTPMGSHTPMSHSTSQPHTVGMGMSIHSPPMYSTFQAGSPPPTETASFPATPNISAQRPHVIPMV